MDRAGTRAFSDFVLSYSLLNCLFVLLLLYVCMYICVYIYIYIYTCLCLYIYTQIHIYIYIYMLGGQLDGLRVTAAVHSAGLPSHLGGGQKCTSKGI